MIQPISLSFWFSLIRRWLPTRQGRTGHSIPINSLVYIFSGFLSVFTAEYCENLEKPFIQECLDLMEWVHSELIDTLDKMIIDRKEHDYLKSGLFSKSRFLKSFKEIVCPKLYWESFFSNQNLFHAFLQGTLCRSKKCIQYCYWLSVYSPCIFRLVLSSTVFGRI